MEKQKYPEGWKVIFFLGIHFLSDFVPESIFFEIKRTLYYSVYFYLGIFLAKMVAPWLADRLHGFMIWYQSIPKAGILSFIGTYSLEIYVLHCFITAANRLILIKLGIINFYINITVNAMIAILLPVLAAVILKKLRLHAWFFKPASALTKHTSVR